MTKRDEVIAGICAQGCGGAAGSTVSRWRARRSARNSTLSSGSANRSACLLVRKDTTAMNEMLGFDYGQFQALVPLLVMYDRLRAQMLDGDLVWVLPPSDVLPGVTQAYGIDVQRADVPQPLLAHRGGLNV